MKKIYVLALAFFLVPGAFNMTFAVEVQEPIIIQQLFVSSADNLHFRVVSSTPNMPLCTGGPPNSVDPGTYSFAYVNETDSGAKGKIAALMTAYALGKHVTLVTEPVQFSQHIYCRIVEFVVW